MPKKNKHNYFETKKFKNLLSSILQNKYINIGIFLSSFIILLLPFFFPNFFKDIKEYRALGLIGILVANFFGSETILVPSLSILFVGIGGNLYNPILVGLSAALGSSLGETISFAFGFSLKKVSKIQQHKFTYFVSRRVFRRYGSTIIFFAALIPNPFFDIVAIVAGLTSFSFWRFFITLFAARFLRDVAIASIGKLF